MSAATLILPLAAAALFTALGVVCLVLARREPEFRITLSGIGRISPPTHFVAGLACLGLAYHIVVYTLELRQFRAPWWVAVTVAVVAVMLSLAVDAVENRKGSAN